MTSAARETRGTAGDKPGSLIAYRLSSVACRRDDVPGPQPIPPESSETGSSPAGGAAAAASVLVRTASSELVLAATAVVVLVVVAVVVLRADVVAAGRRVLVRVDGTPPEVAPATVPA